MSGIAPAYVDESVGSSIPWRSPLNLASGGARSPAVTDGLRERLVANWYELLRDRLAALPPATTQALPSDLDNATFALADALEGWLEAIGFTLADVDGGLYFDVLRHDF